MKADLSKWILFLSLHDVSGIDISDNSMSCLSCCFVTSSDESAKAGLSVRSLLLSEYHLCRHSNDIAQ